MILIDLSGNTGTVGMGYKRYDYASKNTSRILIFCFVFIIGCIHVIQAQSHQDIFNEGNRLLNESRYNEALSEYRKLDDINMESGARYINMGIAATRIDSLGLAKFYFTKAMDFVEVQLAADEGLQFIEWELGRRGARLPQLAWTRITNRLLFQVNHNHIVGFGIILLNIGVIFITMHWLRTYKSKTNRFIGTTLVSTSLLIILIGIIVQLNTKNYNQAVQISREAQVRIQPNEEAEIIQTGYEGFLYIVDEKRSLNSPEWKYVRMSNGARGWTESNHLKKFK
jgi:tetratricopeptide (TPR) repeat protein